MTLDEQIIDMRGTGATFTQIAEKVGVTKGVVSGVIFRHQRQFKEVSSRLTDDDVPVAVAFWNKGFGTREIARFMRVSEAAVTNSLAAEREKRRKAAAA